MKKFFILIIAAPLLYSIFFLACKKNNTGPNYASTTGGYGSTTTGGGTTPAQIIMQNSMYSPSTFTIPAGTSITWTNKDGYTHTVTSNDKIFDSGDIPAGKNYSYTFSNIGTYAYYCKYHRAMGMTGTVVVK